jgi:hypothetical protein
MDCEYSSNSLLLRNASSACMRAVMSVRMEMYFSMVPSAPTKGAIMLSTQ